MSELTLNDLPQSFRDGIHHLQEECKTLSEDNSALRARIAELEAENEELQEAIGTVCEGWTLPDGARKILEAALWRHTKAKSHCY